MVKAPPPRTSDEWARDKRIMPPAAPVPGPFNPDSNPYMKPVAWAFAQPQFRRVTFVMGTQMGKSVTMENVVGHRLDEDPTPVLYVTPTKPLITSTVEPKFMDMFRECAALWRKYDKRRSTQFTKWIGGTKFRFAWAGSPTELAADSAGLILVDEVDRIVNTGEGDTTEIIEARGDAYVDSKVGYTATPLRGRVTKRKHPDTGLEHWQVGKKGAVTSKVWRLWQSGTRHEWAIPCPNCLDYFIPHLDLLWWPGQGSKEECSPDVAEREARLICSCCGEGIEDKYRPWMNARGVAVAPGQSVTKARRSGDQVLAGEVTGTSETEGSSHFSLWVSGLVSFAAKKSYGFLAKKLLEAQRSGDPATLMGVTNTGFGQLFAEVGDVPTWEEIRSMRWAYASGELVLPDPRQIFCTIDVQKNRLEYTVRAWFTGMGSQLLEEGELWGNTDEDSVWDDLSELIDQEYGGHPINETGIDIGYRDDQVFAFINAHKGRAIALRGREKLDKPFKKYLVEVDRKGKTRKRGDAYWAFDSPLAKRWVHSRISRAQSGEADRYPGWWLIPTDVTDDYCKQIVGEEWSEETGTYKQVGENHKLDCEAMQYVMALRAKLHRRKRGALTMGDLKRLANGESGEIKEESEPADEEPSSGQESQPKAPPKRARFKVKKRRP
tara:strand:+ start:14201 stop:16189 length:1989 start_codon:yes stop_codon:yes gene_type:complete